MFDFNQPAFEFFDQEVLLETIAECKFRSHTGLNSIAKLFSAEVGGGVAEQAVLHLDSHSEIPERHIALGHSEQFNASDRLPVLRKVALVELDHKIF